MEVILPQLRSIYKTSPITEKGFCLWASQSSSSSRVAGSAVCNSRKKRVILCFETKAQTLLLCPRRSRRSFLGYILSPPNSSSVNLDDSWMWSWTEVTTNISYRPFSISSGRWSHKKLWSWQLNWCPTARQQYCNSQIIQGRQIGATTVEKTDKVPLALCKLHARERNAIFHHYLQVQQLEKQIFEIPQDVWKWGPPRSLLLYDFSKYQLQVWRVGSK